MDDPVVRVGGTNKSHGGNVMDKYLKESRDFWRDRALFLAREAVKDEERHGRALAAREGEVARLREALTKAIGNIVHVAGQDWLPVTDGIVAGMLLDLEAALAAPPPGDGAGE